MAAGGRRPGATRGSLVSGLPTTELPSMSKGKALSSPDAALEQAAPQRSHRDRTEHQAELKAISPRTSNRAFRDSGTVGLLQSPRGALVSGNLSSLGPDVGMPGSPISKFGRGEKARVRKLARVFLSLSLLPSFPLSSPSFPFLTPSHSVSPHTLPLQIPLQTPRRRLRFKNLQMHGA